MISPKTTICTECKSEYFKDSSEMKELCQDCAHKLYGHKNCKHEFKAERCIKCGWNGQTSEFLKNRIDNNGN